MRSRRRAARRRTSTEPAREPAASSTPVTSLRGGIFGLLLLCGRAALRGLRLRRLLLRLGRGAPVGLDRAEAGLQVVEDEADGRLRRRRRGDQAVAVADDEDA